MTLTRPTWSFLPGVEASVQLSCSTVALQHRPGFVSKALMYHDNMNIHHMIMESQIYIYIYTVFIYIYLYMYTYTCVYIYIHVYISVIPASCNLAPTLPIYVLISGRWWRRWGWWRFGWRGGRGKKSRCWWWLPDGSAIPSDSQLPWGHTSWNQLNTPNYQFSICHQPGVGRFPLNICDFQGWKMSNYSFWEWHG